MDAIMRRTFLGCAGAIVASGLNPVFAQHTVPNSSGNEAPRLKAPANACDCHMHIYDGERFPPARPGPQSRMQSDAADSRIGVLQPRNGTARTSLVTPPALHPDHVETPGAITAIGSAGLPGGPAAD